MTDWNRINRLELELAQARATREDDLIAIGHLIRQAATLTMERDTARNWCVHLEQELAHCEAATVNVPILGTAT